jgi:hypothetical protein
MQFDELYKFIGYGLVCLLLFFIIAKSIRFQLGIIEGLVGIKKDAVGCSNASGSSNTSGSSKAPLEGEEGEEGEEDGDQ